MFWFAVLVIVQYKKSANLAWTVQTILKWFILAQSLQSLALGDFGFLLYSGFVN